MSDKTSPATITAVQFVPDPSLGSIPSGHNRVVVTLSDGRAGVEAFSYYTDELEFAESELLGKTLAEAADLRRRKDVAYLQS